jgi:hypothetical protein
LAARHLDILVDAEDVGELEPQEVDLILSGQLQHLFLAGATQIRGEAFQAGAFGRCGLALRSLGHGETQKQ